jgi:hypothetical protein
MHRKHSNADEQMTHVDGFSSNGPSNLAAFDHEVRYAPLAAALLPLNREVVSNLDRNRRVDICREKFSEFLKPRWRRVGSAELAGLDWCSI